MVEEVSEPIYCVRNRIPKSADEHLSCLYCFERQREVVERGERSHFCDFVEGSDPVSFGFPEGTLRERKG